FFGAEKIPHMRAMILANNEKDRRAALKTLLPMQRNDFIGVFRAMDGFPVTIRTLDPPLHEFLPRREELMVDIETLPIRDATAKTALVADEIAKQAQFFSFSTNDLTQTTWGFSRDDVNKILPTYLAEGIIKQDPFNALDQEGVGQLVKIATERGRKTRSNLKVGICGEHGGEPSSVEFCYRTGLNYVSCSPFRVLTARLAAAQAAATDTLKIEGGRTK